MMVNTHSSKSARCVWHKSCVARLACWHTTNWTSTVQLIKARQNNVVPHQWWKSLTGASTENHGLFALHPCCISHLQTWLSRLDSSRSLTSMDTNCFISYLQTDLAPATATKTSRFCNKLSSVCISLGMFCVTDARPWGHQVSKQTWSHTAACW